MIDTNSRMPRYSCLTDTGEKIVKEEVFYGTYGKWGTDTAQTACALQRKISEKIIYPLIVLTLQFPVY